MKVSDYEEERAAPPTRRETLVPVLAVSAVAAVAVVTAVMVKQVDRAPEPQQASMQVDVPVANAQVVKAPPLNAPATSSMGGAAACRECGVVQMVVAVYGDGRKEPSGYQMHIRMDDGTVRTIEQRGALAAGSRVVVDGRSVKPMT
jgi:hypothetical protein